MPRQKSLKLSKGLFWDVDYKDLNPTKHRQFILDRVLAFGSIKDLRAVLNLYGKKTVKTAARTSRNLGAKSRNFWQSVF